MDNPCIRDWQKMFLEGKFDINDYTVQHLAGWTIYNCGKRQLARRLLPMGYMLCMLKDGGKLDLDNHFLFFSNEKVFNGTTGETFDTIYICSLNGATLYRITRKEDIKKPTWNVYTKNTAKPLHSSSKSHRLAGWLSAPHEEGI